MSEINWVSTENWPSKMNLENGIREWVSQQTGIPNASFEWLHQASANDLMLLAMAMGYKPPARIEQVLRDRFARLALERLRYEAESAVKYDRPIFLHDQSSED